MHDQYLASLRLSVQPLTKVYLCQCPFIQFLIDLAKQCEVGIVPGRVIRHLNGINIVYRRLTGRVDDAGGNDIGAIF